MLGKHEHAGKIETRRGHTIGSNALSIRNEDKETGTPSGCDGETSSQGGLDMGPGREYLARGAMTSHWHWH